MFFGDEGKGWALFLIWVSSTFGGNADACIGGSVVSSVCVRALWELASFGCFRLVAARVLLADDDDVLVAWVVAGPPCSPLPSLPFLVAEPLLWWKSTFEHTVGKHIGMHVVTCAWLKRMREDGCAPALT